MKSKRNKGDEFKGTPAIWTRDHLPDSENLDVHCENICDHLMSAHEALHGKFKKKDARNVAITICEVGCIMGSEDVRDKMPEGRRRHGKK